jgi:glycosyltransferase involved in cell wall biosynthesis
MLEETKRHKMDMWRCGAVVIARDEGKNIRACLESLRKQTIDLFLVVVNDGSLDDTGNVASEYADIVVTLQRHEENWTGLPELAGVFNAGFDVLNKRDMDYVLISGSDGIYPPSYVLSIVSRMEKENIVLCSGVPRGERSSSWIPRGSGRVINAKWFKSIGFRYPLNYGFEAYLVYKALSQGRKIAVFQDLTFESSRGTRFFRKKMYLWGKGMKALNYWWPYAFGRALIIGIRSPPNCFALMRGYMSKVEQYEDIKDFVSNFQKKKFIRRVINSLGL